jgi:hypothetical protein
MPTLSVLLFQYVSIIFNVFLSLVKMIHGPVRDGVKGRNISKTGLGRASTYGIQKRSSKAKMDAWEAMRGFVENYYVKDKHEIEEVDNEVRRKI